MSSKYYQQQDYYDSETGELKTSYQEEKKSNYSFYFRLSGFVFTVIAVFLVVSMNMTGNAFYAEKTDLHAQRFQAARNAYSIGIQVITPDYDQPKSLENLPWDAIAEPYKSQRFEISSFSIDSKSFDVETNADSLSIAWVINGTTYNKAKPSVTLTKTGVIKGTVTITTTSSINVVPSGVTFSYEFTVGVKYVRREIRTLTETDRTNFFDALHKIYTVDSDTGKALYGSKFQTAEYFLVKHLNGAATSDCDHWHDGEFL